jgi:outer membrane protein insertion porin family
MSSYYKQEEYQNWNSVLIPPIERTYGGFTTIGLLLPAISRRLRLSVELGAEHIRNNNPQALPESRSLLQPIIDRTFQAGGIFWAGLSLIKDTRNHRVYPSEGYKISWNLKSAPEGLNSTFGYVKSEFDWSWYTPLIGKDSLVLMLHAWAGIIDTVAGEKIIPYKELFHMGGQTTVRGFLFGEIGPAWQNDSPLGARKAFLFNTELIFPLFSDYNMKAHVFYDAGAGWDTPKYGIDDHSRIKRDKFNLRHSVGFGLNLMNPFPAKIDWGYKLDRDRKAGESPHEFHISMNKAF